VGRKDMTEEELEIRLINFLAKISEWATGHSIIYTTDQQFKNGEEQINSLLNADPKDLYSYGYEAYQADLFRLTQYHSYLNLVLAREKSTRSWADQGFNYLLAGKTFPPYTRWEEKKFSLMRESKVAAKLQELTTTCEARISILEARMKGVEGVIKIIENVARNKMYDRTS
jgi:hypothetical protein